MMKTVLVTGSAGFIGANLVKRLFKEMVRQGSPQVAEGDSSRACRGTIVGLDNMNSYYDPSLKEYRLQELEKSVPEGIDWKSLVAVPFITASS